MQGPSRQLRLAGVVSAALAAGQAATARRCSIPAAESSRGRRVTGVCRGWKRRLARFLRDAVDVSPHSVFVVAALAGQSALTATRHASNPAVSDALREHAQRLAEVASLPGRCATVRPGGPSR